MKLPDGGKLVSWTGFIFGTVVSVAANVLAARIPPADAKPDWAPRVDTQLGSAVWPLALLLSIEVLARVAWPKGLWWGIARFGGLSIVASGAFAISYQHINHVLASWGYEMLSQGVGPLVIDGLMIICGVAMLSKPGTLRKLLIGKDAPEFPAQPEPEQQPIFGNFEPQVSQWSTQLGSSGVIPQAPEVLKPLPEANGRKVTAALRRGPKPRPVTGQGNDEILAILRAEIERGEHPDLTKRGLMDRFKIGASRYTQISAELKRKEDA